MSVIIRRAKKTDLEIINEIYNQAVAKQYQTADLIPVTLAQRKVWFDDHDAERYLIHVIELNNRIVGWSSLSKYREGRGALKNTAEISYYIESTHQGKGYGTNLLERTILEAQGVGFKNLVALLLSSNEISIRILEKYAFREWGRIPRVAEIGSNQFDHLYFGRRIG